MSFGLSNDKLTLLFLYLRFKLFDCIYFANISYIFNIRLNKHLL